VTAPTLDCAAMLARMAYPAARSVHANTAETEVVTVPVVPVGQAIIEVEVETAAHEYGPVPVNAMAPAWPTQKLPTGQTLTPLVVARKGEAILPVVADVVRVPADTDEPKGIPVPMIVYPAAISLQEDGSLAFTPWAAAPVSTLVKPGGQACGAPVAALPVAMAATCVHVKVEAVVPAVMALTPSALPGQ